MDLLKYLIISNPGVLDTHISLEGTSIFNMKHWTNYLPEAGTIIRFGSEQEHLSAVIIDKVNDLNNLRVQYLREENRLVLLAKQDWTIDEINSAMEMANKLGGG